MSAQLAVPCSATLDGRLDWSWLCAKQATTTAVHAVSLAGRLIYGHAVSLHHHRAHATPAKMVERRDCLFGLRAHASIDANKYNEPQSRLAPNSKNTTMRFVKHCYQY